MESELELKLEELEPVIAPGVGLGNHNETFVAAQTELEAEELEPVIAPGISPNHNETFLISCDRTALRRAGRSLLKTY